MKFLLGYATCPSCGAGVSTDPGQPVPQHQKPDDSREQFSGGTGQ